MLGKKELLWGDCRGIAEGRRGVLLTEIGRQK